MATNNTINSDTKKNNPNQPGQQPTNNPPQPAAPVANQQAQPPTQKTQQTPQTPPPQSIAPAQAEQINPEIIEEKAEEKETMLEDQGPEEDVFWAVQRVVWSVIKALFIIGLIAFLIWTIWGGNEDDTAPVTEILSTKTSTSSFASEQAPITAGQMKDLEEKFNNWRKENAIPSSVIWLKDAYTLFQTPSSKLITASTPTERNTQIDSLLFAIKTLAFQAEQMQKILIAEIDEFSQKAQLFDKETTLNRIAFYNSLRLLKSAESDIYLRQSIEAEKMFIESKTQAQARKTIFENIQKYDKKLRILHNSILANKRALAQQTQVVDFPSSNLNLIISPQQWQAGQ